MSDGSNTKCVGLSDSATKRSTKSPDIHIFLVTIKCNSDIFTSRKHLLSIMAQLKRGIKGDWGEPTIELDELFRLHIHVMVYVKSVPYFKKWTKKWSPIICHFQKVDSPPQAIRYIRKHKGHEQYIQDEYEVVSFCHFNKLFKD